MLVSNYDPINATTTTDLGDIMSAYNAVKRTYLQHLLADRERRKNATFAEIVDEMRVQDAISRNVFTPFTSGNV